MKSQSRICGQCGIWLNLKVLVGLQNHRPFRDLQIRAQNDSFYYQNMVVCSDLKPACSLERKLMKSYHWSYFWNIFWSAVYYFWKKIFLFFNNVVNKVFHKTFQMFAQFRFTLWLGFLEHLWFLVFLYSLLNTFFLYNVLNFVHILLSFVYSDFFGYLFVYELVFFRHSAYHCSSPFFPHVGGNARVGRGTSLKWICYWSGSKMRGITCLKSNFPRRVITKAKEYPAMQCICDILATLHDRLIPCAYKLLHF